MQEAHSWQIRDGAGIVVHIQANRGDRLITAQSLKDSGSKMKTVIAFPFCGEAEEVPKSFQVQPVLDTSAQSSSCVSPSSHNLLKGVRESHAADDSEGGALDMCCSERLPVQPRKRLRTPGGHRLQVDTSPGLLTIGSDIAREECMQDPGLKTTLLLRARSPPAGSDGDNAGRGQSAPQCAERDATAPTTLRASSEATTSRHREPLPHCQEQPVPVRCLTVPGKDVTGLLACGVLWFSGYGHIWLQNATDLILSSLTILKQLGPTAWPGTGTWGVPSLLLVSLSVGLVLITTLVWHLLKAAPEPPTPVPPEDRRQSVSRQPSFTYSEWMEEKVEDDFLDLDPVPETPVFDCVMDIKPEADPASLTVKSMGLQERRGSNVSLTLDMCTPGCNEEGFGYLVSPREESAHEYLLSASRVLRAEELHEKALDPFLLQAEFFEIPMNFVDPKEYDIPGLVRKNRYKTILPNPHSRVCLTSPDPDDPLSSYINANYIRVCNPIPVASHRKRGPDGTILQSGSCKPQKSLGWRQGSESIASEVDPGLGWPQGYGGEEKVYIATQGPIVSTIADFWRMVWQEHTPIIVMITNIEEMNEKCTEYWPEEQVVHDGVEITVQKVIHTEDYRLRLISLRSGAEERGLKHYWFTSWPDQKTPDRAPPLLHLVREVEEAAQQEGPHCAPIVVHCSAGIGRTGCFIATSICCQQLRQEGVVDILKTTCQLRQDRGGMIQTCEQYQFVHHVMSLYEKQLSRQSPE
ncbi:Tyrosine-protein phosphatase non-receptor type 5 [Sciurus carolinensis]|uniref:protein-tyrosine-phosphatase n=1 Tax=Sciurus carolinensis TaxID=30640 RepID=A0AA41N3L0_SCICA|nr:Tyrosine-protein phosphatase non-receptor type 5 [Sciurus carolinensis]